MKKKRTYTANDEAHHWEAAGELCLSLEKFNEILPPPAPNFLPLKGGEFQVAICTPLLSGLLKVSRMEILLRKVTQCNIIIQWLEYLIEIHWKVPVKWSDIRWDSQRLPQGKREHWNLRENNRELPVKINKYVPFAGWCNRCCLVVKSCLTLHAVSYTHLTLPTKA